MGFIKDALDVKVFFLVVIIAVCMVAFLVVFHKNFEDVNTKYEEKVGELNSTYNKLLGTQERLNETVEDLELTNLKEEDLKKKYNELLNKNERLEKDKLNLQKEVSDKNSEIGDLKTKNTVLQDSLDKEKSTNSKLRSRINCFEGGGANC
ncbi:hypothetical protein J4216_03435 [Candidatus Woesearchaeota archaeon]|nr:hypothetical protein [Candidatus Woesearchaeota archaeon]